MTKEIEKVLKNIRKYDAQISDIELEIADLKDLHSISISGINYDNLVKTNSLISKTELQAMKDLEIERTIEILEYKKRHLERFLSRIDNAICSLNDIEKQIIQMKCIDNKIWRFITFEVGLEERQCREIKKRALKKISNVINIEDIIKFDKM
ncbi:hypothetical protein R9X47_18050 [Wukongibacter baidiensis]|uniref:hypothetical protein n=1 Tax=Wukongibacter baidiensis TaxID=1723361 RepID=UPI003D7FD23A